MKLNVTALYEGIVSGAIVADIKNVAILVIYHDGTVYSTSAYPMEFPDLLFYMEDKLKHAVEQSVKSVYVVINDCSMKYCNFMNTLISF